MSTWRFNLEKSVTERRVAKEVTQDPYGSNQSIIDVNVRTNTKGNMNQQEVLEAVSFAWILSLHSESMGSRESTVQLASHDALLLLDDGLRHFNLHNNVHAEFCDRSSQAAFLSRPAI